MSGLTLSPLSIYGQSQGLNYLSNPLITNPNPTSNLIYIFDSLILYKAPIINFSSFSNQVGIYLITSSRGNENFTTGPLIPSLQPNKIEFKIGSEALNNITADNLTIILTSSYFNIPEGSEVNISGSFFQPDMNNYLPILGLPAVEGQQLIIDSGSSIEGWITSSNSAERPYIQLSVTGSTSYPYPQVGPFINYNIIDFAYFSGYPLLSKPYDIPSSGKHKVHFLIASRPQSSGGKEVPPTGKITAEIRQNNKTKGIISFNVSEISIPAAPSNPIEGYEQIIEFDSESTTFQLRFSHSGVGTRAFNYRIRNISTSSFSEEGYLSPEISVRIVSGSYNGSSISNEKEILSTVAKFDDFRTASIPLVNNLRLNESINNAFLEIKFFIPKSLIWPGTGSNIAIRRGLANRYNVNPISINNLLINTGDVLEKYAFRIEKTVNINTENVPSSEIINKDEEYFVSFIDNELTPSFKFSITSFADFPNRLKDSYHIFTASFGSRKDLVERGNLVGRNYIPIDLSIGETEEDDLPNFYNFDGGGVIIPLNISEEFKTNKQSIIEFSKTVKNNNSLTF
jgi:hypothetical protein